MSDEEKKNDRVPVPATCNPPGTWFLFEEKWYVKRAGNRPDGEILAYHNGFDGVVVEGPPPGTDFEEIE